MAVLPPSFRDGSSISKDLFLDSSCPHTYTHARTYNESNTKRLRGTHPVPGPLLRPAQVSAHSRPSTSSRVLSGALWDDLVL